MLSLPSLHCRVVGVVIDNEFVVVVVLDDVVVIVLEDVVAVLDDVVVVLTLMDDIN